MLALALQGAHQLLSDVFESKAPSKKDLERLIVEYGGEFAQARTEGNMAIPVGGRLGRQ
jgi:hypothetical protein